MLRGGDVQQIIRLQREGQSARQIAASLGLSRNTVRKYLAAPQVPRAVPRRRRPSKLDAYAPYVEQRLALGVSNCMVLLRELRTQGYAGSYTILKDFVQARRPVRAPVATRRYDPEPGEQAQVDWGSFPYQAQDGGRKSVLAFVMVLAWSRALYVEFVPRADVHTFLRNHLSAFAHFGGLPRRCLYDNAKVVVLGREAGEPVWNPTFLDFSLRLGFEPQLCRPYRAQTKGRVERSIQYVRQSFWPAVRFTDLADLNAQVQTWCAEVADRRLHGTTGETPAERLVVERTVLRGVPEQQRLAPFLREARQVGRDGFVQWERGWYGVPWQWAGKTVQVSATTSTVELWAGEERLAVHPRATRPNQRFALPGQWAELATQTARPREALGRQVATQPVEQRSLAAYAAVAGGTGC